MSGKLKVSPFKIAGPNDRIYRRGPQVFVPVSRPSPVAPLPSSADNEESKTGDTPARAPILSADGAAPVTGKRAASKKPSSDGASSGRVAWPHYGTWMDED